MHGVVGGPVLGERDIFGKKAFSDNFVQYEIPKIDFCETVYSETVYCPPPATSNLNQTETANL